MKVFLIVSIILFALDLSFRLKHFASGKNGWSRTNKVIALDMVFNLIFFIWAIVLLTGMFNA